MHGTLPTYIRFQRIGWIVLVYLAIAGIGAADRIPKEALAVRHMLSRIATSAPATDGAPRTMRVTQREVNAYIAYRLGQQKAPMVDSLRIALLANNHVEGVLRLDPQKLELDTLLGDALDFRVKGVLVTRDGAARLDWISIYLNGRRVKPQVLTFVLDTAARRCCGAEIPPDRWVDLPQGVKQIAIQKGVALVSY